MGCQSSISSLSLSQIDIQISKLKKDSQAYIILSQINNYQFANYSQVVNHEYILILKIRTLFFLKLYDQCQLLVDILLKLYPKYSPAYFFQYLLKEQANYVNKYPYKNFDIHQEQEVIDILYKCLKNQPNTYHGLVYCKLAEKMSFLDDIMLKYNAAQDFFQKQNPKPNKNYSYFSILSEQKEFSQYFSTIEWINILSRFKYNEEALKLIKKYIKKHPNDHMGYFQQGLLFKRNDDHAKAIECHQKSIEIQPDHQESYFQLGYSYGCKGQFQKAIDMQHVAIQLNGTYKNALVNLGYCYSRQNNVKLALEKYRECIEIHPNCKQAYLNMGIQLSDLNKHKEAYISFQKCIQIDKEYAKAYVCLGVTSIKLNQFTQGINYFVQAVIYNPIYIDQISSLGLKQIVQTLVDLRKQNQNTIHRLKLQIKVLDRSQLKQTWFRKEINEEIAEFLLGKSNC